MKRRPTGMLATFIAGLSFLILAPLERSTAFQEIPGYTARRNCRDFLKTALAERVADKDDWVRLSSNSFQNIVGKSLLETMEVDSIEQVHNHERFAVISHGTEDDPIFCYANKAALLQFEYGEDEFFKTPSRKSAPSGDARKQRQGNIDKSVASKNEITFIEDAVRQSKNGKLFKNNYRLWNVWDDDGNRIIGQTALFDRASAVVLEDDS